jgi:hypothetical protein
MVLLVFIVNGCGAGKEIYHRILDAFIADGRGE